jgi:putative transposase
VVVLGLRQHGRLCEELGKRVLRLMREDNLLCLKKKIKPVTPDSSHGLPVYPNLRKSTTVTGLNQGC